MVTGIEALVVKKILIVAIVGAAAWGFLRDFLSRVIVPAVRRHVSEALGNAFLTVLQVLDNVKCLVDRALAKAFVAARDLIKAVVLRAETIYRKKSPTTVQTTTTLYTQEGEVIKEHKIEGEMAWHDVPPQVKEHMLENRAGAVRSPLVDELFAEINNKVKKEMLL